MNLTTKVLLGMAFGIALGLFFNLTGMNAEGSFVNTNIVNGLFHIVGKMFVNMLKMLVVPLVFSSLICGVCGIGDVRILGRVGSKSFGLYMLTTAIAIATAILIAASFGIGQGLNLATDAAFSGKAAPPLSQVLIDIIPKNPINTMANGDMLPIIFFSIMVGISMLMVGEKAKIFIEGAEIANEIMMKMVNIIMALAPLRGVRADRQGDCKLGSGSAGVAGELCVGIGRRVNAPSVRDIDDCAQSLLGS